MAVRQLERLFRGLAAANKFIESTKAHLAEVFPLLGTRQGHGIVAIGRKKESRAVVDCACDDGGWIHVYDA